LATPDGGTTESRYWWSRKIGRFCAITATPSHPAS